MGKGFVKEIFLDALTSLKSTWPIPSLTLAHLHVLPYTLRHTYTTECQNNIPILSAWFHFSLFCACFIAYMKLFSRQKENFLSLRKGEGKGKGKGGHGNSKGVSRHICGNKFELIWIGRYFYIFIMNCLMTTMNTRKVCVINFQFRVGHLIRDI